MTTATPPAPGGVALCPDGALRCPWATRPAEYTRYHDEEWGRAVPGQDALYERVVLEGFQAGLSWLTILQKREAFREAYSHFRVEEVAAYTEADVARLLTDPRLVRNERKVRAAIKNAQAALHTDLGAAVEAHTPAPRPRPRTTCEVPTRTEESTALAQTLKQAGFVMVGPTSMYALLQAVGAVDDHLEGCFVPMNP